MLGELKIEDFHPRIGERFRIEGIGEGPVELELSEARGLPSPPTEQRSAFSLLFTGPKEPILPQQIFTPHHAEMGELPLFLVPLAPDGQGARYEAIFT